MTIYSNFDYNRNNFKKAPKRNLVKKIVTGMLFIITFVILSTLCAKEYKKTMIVLNDYHQDYEKLVEYANRDYQSFEYEAVEKWSYLIELFPYGVTDNQDYQAGGCRLIKVTWYNDKRTKVDDIEYYIVPDWKSLEM